MPWNMNHFIFLSLVLALTSFAAETKRGACRVERVFAGNGSTYLVVDDCNETLGFKKKEFQLDHHQSVFVQEQVGNYINSVRFDNVGDVLGIKQTAELAFLFQKKLHIETNLSGKILFVSLKDPVVLAQPMTTECPTTPKPETQPNDGFQPVPISGASKKMK